MKLWILEALPWQERTGHHCSWTRDGNMVMVVRAETEKEARELANKAASEENNTRHFPWLHFGCSSCNEIVPNGLAEVLVKGGSN